VIGSNALAAVPPAFAASPCDASLQSRVDAAPAGATVTAPACIFRETVRIDKPLTLVGQPGMEIRGSDVWSGWVRTGSGWASADEIPALPSVGNVDGRCGERTNRCLLPEQVFADGEALTRVPSSPQPGAGQFALDGKRHVLIADDPTSHTIEVSTRRAWVVSNSDGITLSNLTMRHAANDTLRGAVSNDGHSNWTIQDSALSDAHGAVVSVHHGNNVQVLRSDISRGGDMGIHGTLVNVGLIQGNHIHDNNTDQFSPEWGAGGVKVTEVHDFTIDSNEVDNNAAPGLWCDISCQGVTIANNRVHHNQWQGIIFEISDKAAIHDNVVWQNGWNAPTWGWGAGILVSSSADAEVYNNTVAWNKAGISVIDLNRPDRVTPVNNYVHDNVIVRNTIASGDAWSGLSLAWLNDGTGRLFDPTANNRGANNRYWYDQPEGNGIRGSWQQQYQQLADLQATPGNQGGRYLSDDEQSQLLASHALPAAGGPA
jgi:hypothetical protein